MNTLAEYCVLKSVRMGKFIVFKPALKEMERKIQPSSSIDFA